MSETNETEIQMQKPQPHMMTMGDVVNIGVPVLQVLLRAIMKAQQHDKGSPFSLDDMLPLGQAIDVAVKAIKEKMDSNTPANG